MDVLQNAWSAHPLGILDPLLKFLLAWKRLHNTYKAIQVQATSSFQTLDLLTAQLVQLKLDILMKLTHQIEEYDQLRHKIQEIEMNEANHWHSLARVKWLGIGDEPYMTFF